jgi:acetate kinase
LKFAAYRTDSVSGRLLRVDAGTDAVSNDAVTALNSVLSHVRPHIDGAFGAVGHRIVFGGPVYTAPVRANDAVLRDLEALVVIEPLHLRSELSLVRAALQKFPNVPQVLCFDTAFHRQSKPIAKRLPLPADIDPLLQRYGFHGLSYEYIASELGRGSGRTVVAHLGSGASLCALEDGKPVDTTMGFSALGGLMMGTRPGDLDPGVVLRLLDSDAYDAERLSDLLYFRSGLLGVSGTTADMQNLISMADRDACAREAIELFIYQLRKQLGSMIAVLGGLKTLVFTAGIGEHAPLIRAAACQGLDYLGLRFDDAANQRNERVISSLESRVAVLVVPTDENLMIARHTLQLV